MSLDDRSINNLKTCHIDLQFLFAEVSKHFKFIVTEGYRGKEAQDKAFKEKKSQVKFPNGKHNSFPSNALDAYPAPIDFKDIQRIHYFGGFVLGVAEMLKLQGKISHDIRWGGDWDSDTEMNDEKFRDLGHFELIK